MEFPNLPCGVKLDNKAVNRDCASGGLIAEESELMQEELAHNPHPDPPPTHVGSATSILTDNVLDYDESDLNPAAGMVPTSNFLEQILMQQLFFQGFPTEHINQVHSEFMHQSTVHESDDSKGKGKERVNPLRSNGLAGLLPSLFQRQLEIHSTAYRPPYPFLEEREDEMESDFDDMDVAMALSKSLVQAPLRHISFDYPRTVRTGQPEFIAGPSRITLDDL